MTDIAELGIKVDSGGVKKATKRLDGMERQSKRTGKATDGLISKMKGFAVLAGVAAGMWKVIAAHREFQKSISELSAITGAAGADLEFYKQQALDMGSSTTFAASEVATAFKLVASAKPDLLESKEALSFVTQEVLTLAEASGQTLPEAAKALGGSLNQFGASADQASKFINVLAAGSKLGASEINQTAMALKTAGTVASSIGLSFEQTNAAIQTLASVSIKGQEAGTGLRGVLLKLSTQTKNEFNPEIVGLSSALQNLSDAELSTAEKADIFGQESITAATALINQAGSVDELTAALSGTDTAYEQAATNTNNLDGDIKEMGSSWSNVALVLGDIFNPVLRSATQLLTWFGKVASSIAIAIGDMGDAIGAYAAASASALSFDLEGSKAILDAREQEKAANEERLANLWAGNDAREKSKERIEAEAKAEEEAAAKRQAIRAKALADARALREEERKKREMEAQEKAQKQETQERSEAEEIRRRNEQKFIAMAEGFATEREMTFIQEERKREILDNALATKAISFQQHEQYLTEIEREGAEARKKINEAEADAKFKVMNSAFGNLSKLMNTEIKKAFKIGKAAALAQAAIDGGKAIQSAWAAGMATGGPWAPAIAAAYAATAAITSANNINNIRSQSFGGGGGAPTPAGQGSSGVSTSSQPVTAQQEQAKPMQDLVVRRQGSGRWTDDEVEDMLNQFAERSQDSDVTFGRIKFA